jgi:hypothetical protein
MISNAAQARLDEYQFNRPAECWAKTVKTSP